ncbi:hypothetical protein, partial [Paraburkholderia guartelaensis]|uniref:hypothetical protein n=1 Tax=Paraburkholderia guartelaensis TaxID=2546446 RepID=UPI002AB7110A
MMAYFSLFIAAKFSHDFADTHFNVEAHSLLAAPHNAPMQKSATSPTRQSSHASGTPELIRSHHDSTIVLPSHQPLCAFPDSYEA